MERLSARATAQWWCDWRGAERQRRRRQRGRPNRGRQRPTRLRGRGRAAAAEESGGAVRLRKTSIHAASRCVLVTSQQTLLVGRGRRSSRRNKEAGAEANGAGRRR